MQVIRKVSNSVISYFRFCSDQVQARPVLRMFLIGALFFLIFFSVYFSVSTLSSADDHFFHFQFAAQMRQHGFINAFQDFKAIFFSKMAQGNAYFIYYNFLFYLAIIPFTLISPLYLGIKLYAVFAVTLAVTMLYWCLRKVNVKYPFIWTVIMLALSSTESLWRFFLSRPYALAPSLLLVLIVFLYKKKYMYAFVITIIYVFWHSATFFMPPGVAVVFFLFERFYHKRGDYKNLLAVFGGLIVAIAGTYLVSSGFILYMKEIIFGSYADTIIGKRVNIAEGGELYPINVIDLIKANSLIFAAFVSALSVDVFGYIGYRFKRLSSGEYLAGLDPERKIMQGSVLFLIMLFFLGTISVSARFGDYFTLFAGLYVALSFDYVFRSVSIVGSKILKNGIITGLLVALVYVFASNMYYLQNLLAHGPRDNELYAAGTWLNVHTKPGDMVFLANWGLFPPVYYYSPLNRYTTGIEPRFLYTYNPSMYWLSVHIPQNGFVCEVETCPPTLVADEVNAFRSNAGSLAWAKTQGDLIAQVISTTFQSSYVLSSNSFPLFNFVMSHNSHFQLMTYDSLYGYSVYKVNANKPKQN